MIKSQNGFGLIELAIGVVFVGVVIFVGVHIFASQQSPFPTKNALVYLLSQKSDTERSTSLQVDFQDSAQANEDGCSASAVAGFVGTANLTYKDQAHATLTITQNKKPPKSTQTSSTSHLCTGIQDARPSLDTTKNISLSQPWLDSAPSSKSLSINGRAWNVTVDHSAYTLAFTGSEGQHSVQPYLPIDVVELTTARDCMSDSDALNYTKAHGIQLAEQKYPGIDAKYLKLNQYYDQANRDLLVVADDYVKSMPDANASGCGLRVYTDPGGNGTGPIALPLYKSAR